MDFEWDNQKNQQNIVKHGFDLLFAKFVFEDKNVFDFADERFDYGEKRRIAIGKVENRCVVVVYTMRDKTRRLISVRYASQKERRKYNEYNSHE